VEPELREPGRRKLRRMAPRGPAIRRGHRQAGRAAGRSGLGGQFHRHADLAQPDPLRLRSHRRDQSRQRGVLPRPDRRGAHLGLGAVRPGDPVAEDAGAHRRRGRAGRLLPVHGWRRNGSQRLESQRPPRDGRQRPRLAAVAGAGGDGHQFAVGVVDLRGRGRHEWGPAGRPGPLPALGQRRRRDVRRRQRDRPVRPHPVGGRDADRGRGRGPTEPRPVARGRILPGHRGGSRHLRPGRQRAQRRGGFRVGRAALPGRRADDHHRPPAGQRLGNADGRRPDQRRPPGLRRDGQQTGPDRDRL